MPIFAPCRHLFHDGRPCGSPALRGQPLCYHHDLLRRPIPADINRFGEPLLTLPAPHDLHAVQHGFAEVLRLLAREQLDFKHAAMLLHTLREAGTNLARIQRQQRHEDLLALQQTRLQAQLTRTQPQAQAEAPADPHPSTPVTDVVHHPTLGPLAPVPEADLPALEEAPTAHPKTPSSRPERSAVERPPHSAPAVACSPTAEAAEIPAALDPSQIPAYKNEDLRSFSAKNDPDPCHPPHRPSRP